MLDKNIKEQLGTLLWLERKKRRDHLFYVSKKICISPVSLDYLEQGFKHGHWKLYQRLLDFYGKEVKVKIVDKKNSTDVVCF